MTAGKHILANGGDDVAFGSSYVGGMTALHPRISRDPKVMMGKPVISGTRIPVETVVRQFASGADMSWVLKGFPQLSEEDVRAALAYAAECVASPSHAAE